MAGYTDAA